MVCSAKCAQKGGETARSVRQMAALKQAAEAIDKLDVALKSSIEENKFLNRAVQECGEANAAIGNQLREVASYISKNKNPTPQQLEVLKSSSMLDKLSDKLTKTLAESKDLRGKLQTARNELGEAHDTAKRAQNEAARLQVELTRAGAARAEQALLPIKEKLDQILGPDGDLRVLIEIINNFSGSIENKAANLKPLTGDIGTALAQFKESDDINFGSAVATRNQPEVVQNVIMAIASNLAGKVNENDMLRVQGVATELQSISDIITSSLRAVQAGVDTNRSGGKRKRGNGKSKTVRKHKRGGKKGNASKTKRRDHPSRR